MIKKKKKEKASDSLPLQGSSEVGSRDPKRSRFCQRFGGSWQLTGFQAAHVQSVSGRLAGREWAPCLLSMCCGLYNPHLISPSQYPSKVALTPLYRWGNGGSVKCSSLLKDAQLKSNGAGSGALLFDSKPHVFNNRAIVLPVIRKGLGKHEPILMLGYNRNHLLSMRSMCM